MKKCLSLLIALSMLMSIVVFPVATQADTTTYDWLPDGANLIFYEDFESGYDENLLVDGQTSVEISKDGKKVLKFDYTDSQQSASVTTGPATFNTSKVLKLKNTNTSKVNLGTYIYLNDGSAISTTEGYQIVVEYDVMTEGGKFSSADNPFMTFGTVYNGAYPCIMTTYNDTGINFQTGNYASSASDTAVQDWYVRYKQSVTSKKTFKYVIEKNMTDFDTTRFYIDDTLLKTAYKLSTTWNSERKVIDFLRCGNWFGANGYTTTSSLTGYSALEYADIKYLYTKFATNDATNGTTIYLDNIRVYEVPAINFKGLDKTEGVSLSDGVVVNFDQTFDADASTFAVSLASDETNTWIDGGVSEVVMSEDKKSATVKFDTSVVDGTEFKLWIDNEFISEAGAIFHKDLDGVLPAEEYVELGSFATLIPFKVESAPESITNLIPNDPRTFTIGASAAIESASASYFDETVTAKVIGGTNVQLSLADVEVPQNGSLVVELTAADGQTAEVEIPVYAALSEDNIDYIYNDDLSGYETVDLLTDKTGKSYTNGNLVFNTAAANLETAGTAEIVTDATQGNVLKFATKGAANFSVTYRGDDSDILGKVLVMKTKYYAPSDFKNTTSNGNNGSAATLAPSASSTGNASTPAFRPRTGPKLSYNSGNWGHNYMESNHNLNADDWTDITVVIDQTREGTLTDPHISRRYFDGTINTINAYDKDAGGTATSGNHTMYELPPNAYYGTWDFSGYATNYTSGGTNSFGVNKMYGTYTMLANTDGTATYLMMDDFRAFYADRFAVTYVSDNASAFVPTKHTLKVAFNQQITEDQLANLYVADGEGTKIEGWEAELANGGYALDITLPATVEVGSTYTLYATPLFHDKVSYQGLTRNNVDIAAASATIAEYTAFTATADKAEITGFEQGRAAKAVITLSVATSLTDSDAKTAFKVANDEGAEVTEGWTATVSADGLTITLDFTNLETDNYTVTATEDLVNKDGDGLDAEFAGITITARVNKIMLFEENFDGNGTSTVDYTVGEDWLVTAPNAEKWSVATSTTMVDDDFAGVVSNDTVTTAATTAEADISGLSFSGNALKLSNTATGTKHMYVKALVDSEKVSAYPEKVVVYEADVFVNATADGSRMFTPSFDSKTSSPITFMKYSSPTSIKFEGSGNYFEYIAGYGAANKAHIARYHNQNGKIANIKMVIDQRNDVDTAKMIVNGAQNISDAKTYIVDHATFGTSIYEVPINIYLSAESATNLDAFTGFYLHAYATSSKNTEIYVDNIKAYLVDAFEISSVEGATQAFNGDKNAVTFNFTNKVSLEEAQANFTLVDASGTDKTSALTLACGEDDYQIVATVDATALNGGEEYSIVVSPEIQDEFGQPLAHRYEWYDYTPSAGTTYISKKSGTGAKAFDNEADATAYGGTVYTYSYSVTDDGKIAAFNPFLDDQSKPWYGKQKAEWYATEEEAEEAGNTNVYDRRGEDFSGDCYIRDEDAMKLVTTIKLTKSTSLYGEAATAEIGTASDGTASVATTLTLVNPEETALAVWYIVAAYGDYNEMLGCQAGTIEGGVAAGAEETINISFAAKSSNIKSVKVYIWDGYKTMVPYQDAETIYDDYL